MHSCDVLMEISPDFYDELSRSTAFSLYYMCAKQNDTCIKKIGDDLIIADFIKPLELPCGDSKISFIKNFFKG